MAKPTLRQQERHWRVYLSPCRMDNLYFLYLLVSCWHSLVSLEFGGSERTDYGVNVHFGLTCHPEIMSLPNLSCLWEIFYGSPTNQILCHPGPRKTLPRVTVNKYKETFTLISPAIKPSGFLSPDFLCDGNTFSKYWDICVKLFHMLLFGPLTLATSSALTLTISNISISSTEKHWETQRRITSIHLKLFEKDCVLCKVALVDLDTSYLSKYILINKTLRSNKLLYFKKRHSNAKKHWKSSEIRWLSGLLLWAV